MVRAFICIDTPATAKDRIGELQAKLKGVEAQVSWVKPSNIHLTLKFLGPVADTQIDQVVAACRSAARDIGPFEVNIGGAGCFPSARSPRVLWVGITEIPEPLSRLYSEIEGHLAALGFERESRNFAPHLTIGRLNSQRNAAQLAEQLALHGFAPETFVTGEIILMQSQLNPKGAIYTPLAVIPLVAKPWSG
jgi:2'-5' RNA ligase